MTPDSARRPLQLAPLSGPSVYNPGLGAGAPGGFAPHGVRCGRQSSGGPGQASSRGGGGARRRRRGQDTCGGGVGVGWGGEELGAQGFKKVWRGGGRFPRTGRGASRTGGCSCGSQWLGRLTAPAAVAPLSRGAKKLCEPRSPAELPCGAPLPSRSAPVRRFWPSTRVASPSRRLQNWMSERRSESAAAWSAIAGPRGLSSWRCCWGRRWGCAQRWAITPASRPSFSCAPTTGSWKGMGSKARCSFPCTFRATLPTTYRDKNIMVGTTASPRSPPSQCARGRSVFFSFFHGAIQTRTIPFLNTSPFGGTQNKVSVNRIASWNLLIALHANHTPLTHLSHRNELILVKICPGILGDRVFAPPPSSLHFEWTRASCFLNPSTWIPDLCLAPSYPLKGPRVTLGLAPGFLDGLVTDWRAPVLAAPRGR